MISSIITGKDCINNSNLQRLLNEFKSILVISDLNGCVCGAKSKVKKAFGKNDKVTYFKLKACDCTQVQTVDKVVKIAKERQTDLIVSIGTHSAHNLAKAVKYVIMRNRDNFVDSVCCEQNGNNIPDIKLICIAVSAGNHQNLLTGYFEVEDSVTKNIYRLNKDFVKPMTVMLDDKVLDKVSNIAKLGMELSALIVALAAISFGSDEQDKLTAISAVGIAEKINATLSDLFLVQMYAGASFLVLQNNLLNEFVMSVCYYTGQVYSLVMLLTVKNCVRHFIDKLDVNDIKKLDLTYGIELYEDVNLWKDNFYKMIDGKLNKYFADKDIPKKLNEIGLNSDLIEKIFEELTTSFGESEELSRLKDNIYINYW